MVDRSLPISTKQINIHHLKLLYTKKGHDIWHWKSRSWLWTGTKMWQC